MEKIVIIPGSFKPPHAGHLKLVEEIFKKEKVKKMYIIISFKSRYLNENNKTKGEITARQGREIWEIYLKQLSDTDRDKIKIMISERSPVLMAMFLVKGMKKSEEVILVKSDKNVENKRFATVENIAKERGVKIDEWIIPKYKNLNARDMRKAILKGDKKKFEMFLPDGLKKAEIEKIWNIVKKYKI